MKSTHTRETTSDHGPRRTGQYNLHTHVMSNENKSPIEKKYSHAELLVQYECT